MLLARAAVHRPVATTMAVLAIVLGGLIAMFNLPVDLMPNSESKMVTVFVGVRGGMPSEDIENLVTIPIEEAVATLNGLESVTSVSRKDRSTITLDFHEDIDVKRAALDVSERLARIKGKLPKEIEKPIVARYNENDHPIVILSATSSVKTPEILRTMIEKDLKPLLSRVPGVANVEIGGGRQRKILVEFEKSKLETHHLDILEVIRELGANNVNLTSGKYETSRDAWGVQFLGDFKTIDDMKELGVAITKEGSRIRLKDIAVVRDYYLEPDSYARVNSQPSVSIYIQKEAGANTIRAAREVLRIIHDYEKTLPADTGIGVSVDQSVTIRQSIRDIEGALTWGAFLTALVLWIFLKNMKQVGVIVLSIPVAVMGTFFTMLIHSNLMAKFSALPPITINVMSLLGIALGIGRMVDDSIVVFENILHKNEIARTQGKIFTREMAVEATREMALSVASSTLVMVVIFVPIVFISADIRRLYSDVAFTVITSLGASLLMAFTVVPLLASKTMPGPGQTVRDLEFQWERRAREWFELNWPKIEQWIRGRFYRFSSSPNVVVGDPASSNEKTLDPGFRRDDDVRGNDEQRFPFVRYIRRGTAWSIRNRKRVMQGILASLLISALIYQFGLPKEYMGSTEKREFVIFVELKTGTKLDISDKVVAAVEAEINSMPEVKEVVKTISSRVEGWSSKIYVTLSPGAERTRSAQDVIDMLRPRLKSIGGEYDAYIYYTEPTSSQEIIIDVFGQDYITIKDLAVEISKRLQEIEKNAKYSTPRSAAIKVSSMMEKIPGLKTIGKKLSKKLKIKVSLYDIKLRYKPGQDEIKLNVDHARASLFGLNSREIADTLHAEIRGLRATYFNTGSDQVETVARLSEEDRRTLEQVSNLTLMSNGKKRNIVPIEQVIQFENGITPSEVWRKDKERVIQVSANRGRLALSTAVEQIQKQLKGLQVPTGYHYEIGGEYKKLVKSEKEFLYAFVIMIALVYIVLACFFESYVQPLLMLLTIPLATAGSMPALWLTGTSVNMGVYIGLLMLGGTTVSNGIILIDRLNTTRKTRGLYRAVMKVGSERARPIFMTSLTTIAAMVPLIADKGESADLWSPLALTVVSGLAFSSLLTIFVIPAAYVVLEDVKFRFQSSKFKP